MGGYTPPPTVVTDGTTIQGNGSKNSPLTLVKPIPLSYVPPHASTHENGGSDPFTPFTLVTSWLYWGYGDNFHVLLYNRNIFSTLTSGGADSGGSATLSTTDIMGSITLTTGTTAGYRAWWDYGTLTPGGGSYKYRYMTAWMLNLFSQLNARGYLGFMDSLPTATEPPTEANNGIYYRAVNGSTVSDLFAVCRSGGSETSVDLGGNIGGGYPRDMGVTHEYTTAKFYIQSNLVATITTNVPWSTTMDFYAVIQTRTTTAVTGYCGHAKYVGYGG